MPKVNLRLTEEELELLQKWANGSRRSLQREMVYRLFRERSEALSERDATTPPYVSGDGHKADNPTGESTEMRDDTPMTGRSRSESSPASYVKEFKPDFKPVPAKKKGRF